MTHLSARCRWRVADARHHIHPNSSAQHGRTLHCRYVPASLPRLDEGLTLNRPADSRDEDEDFEVEQEEEEQGAKVAKERVRVLHEPKGKEGRNATGVVYWMSRDQRANDNWALLYAQRTCPSPPRYSASAFTHARRSDGHTQNWRSSQVSR